MRLAAPQPSAEPLFSNLVYRLDVAPDELPALKHRINASGTAVLGFIFFLSVLANFVGGIHVDPFLHSLCESCCGIISFVISYVLAREYRASGKRSTFWLYAAFCTMGVLDLFHSFSNESATVFVWFHSMGAMSGGACFALSALYSSRPAGDPPRWRGAFVLAVGAATVLCALAVARHPEVLPPVGAARDGAVDQHLFLEFAAGPVLANVVAAVGFVVAGLVFFQRFRSSDDVLYHAFSSFAFLFFESECLFGFSRLWDVTWWYWHVLKLLVYAGLAVGLAHGFTRAFYELRRSRRELVDLVQRLRASYDSLKETQRQLVESEKLASIGRIASTIAHEIRNPLGAITNSVAVFRHHRELSDEDEELLGIVDGELGRLNRFISQFLDFARPSSLELAPADLGEVIDETLGVFSLTLAERKDVALVKHVDALPSALVDRDAMKQCLWNLLHNAMQAMPSGGLISVRAFQTIRADGPAGEKREIVLSVCDTGEGMPDDALSHLFQPFFSTKAKGTGLGLATVHKIVAQHGGSVSVSTRPRQGSEFHLTIPVEGPAAPATAEDDRHASCAAH